MTGADNLTRACQCWVMERRDGVVFGFTDHDEALAFDDIKFEPESGMTARAFSTATGLSVDNSEALGLIQSERITGEDIAAGRYDGAKVRVWRVDWANVADRALLFRGEIGDVARDGASFTAELRGLTDALNVPHGRSYLRSCSAVLGDERCGVDTRDPQFSVETEINIVDGQLVCGEEVALYPNEWFMAGQLKVLDGAARNLSAAIKLDQAGAGDRTLTLWDDIPHGLASGDRVRLVAGCVRTPDMCRTKFSNFVNYQGFPDIPGEDWLMAVPREGDVLDGGSRSR